MVTTSKRKIEQRKNARQCMISFLNSIKQYELISGRVYALLKSRNHNDYPVLQELLGLTEDETFQFFLLCNLVQGNDSYLRVNEKELKAITMECNLSYFTVNYYIDRKKPAKAHYISFGSDDMQKKNQHSKDTCLANSITLNCATIPLQREARKLIAAQSGTEATPGFVTPASKNLRSPAYKALISPAPKKLTNNNDRCHKASMPLSAESLVSILSCEGQNPSELTNGHWIATEEKKKTPEYHTFIPTISPTQDSIDIVSPRVAGSLVSMLSNEGHNWHELTSRCGMPIDKVKNTPEYHIFLPAVSPILDNFDAASSSTAAHGLDFGSDIFGHDEMEEPSVAQPVAALSHAVADGISTSNTLEPLIPLLSTRHPYGLGISTSSMVTTSPNSVLDHKLEGKLETMSFEAAAKVEEEIEERQADVPPFPAPQLVNISNFAEKTEIVTSGMQPLSPQQVVVSDMSALGGSAWTPSIQCNLQHPYMMQNYPSDNNATARMHSNGADMGGAFVGKYFVVKHEHYLWPRPQYLHHHVTPPKVFALGSYATTAACLGEISHLAYVDSFTGATTTNTSASISCCASTSATNAATANAETATSTATPVAPDSDSQSSNKLDWCSAESLKKSLQARGNKLSSEEIEIAHLINLQVMKTDQRNVQRLVFPRRRGQTEDSIFYKKPGTRSAKYSVRTLRKIVPIVVDMCNECSITLVSLIMALAKLEEENISVQLKTNQSKFELIEESMAMIKIAGIPNNAYHEIRRFADIIWDVKLGASLHNIKNYMVDKCPPGDCTHTILSLQVGSTEASANRKYKNCGVWYFNRPWEVIAARLNYVDSLGALLPSSEISSESDSTILLVSNIDKGSDRTSVMVRIMNEDQGNSGKSTRVLGLISDGANECYGNLKKTFFADANPIKFSLQSLLDNTFVAMRITLRETAGGKAGITAWAIFSCFIADQVQSFPNHSCIKIKEIEGDQYLKSSERCPTIKTLDELGSLYLLRQRESKSYVAVAVASESGAPLTWVTLGEEAIKSKDTELTSVSWKQLKGWEGSDAKMASLLIGHQGSSAKYPCFACTASQMEIDDFLSTTVFREGDFSPIKCHKKYDEFGSRTGKKDDDVRRDLSLNITKPPLLDIPHDKRMYEPCHTLSGNMEHVDKELVKDCMEIEKNSTIYHEAQSICAGLIQDLEDAMNERKIRVTAVKYDRKNVARFRAIVSKDADPNQNIGFFRQLENLTQNANETDNGLKELDEYITCIKEELMHLKQYLNLESDFLTVQVLNYGYLSVAKVLLSQYHGGRKFLFRDAMSVAVNFDAIVAFCIDFMTAITSNSDPLYIEKYSIALGKAKACLAHLGELFKMAESQKKCSPEKATAFKKLCFDFAAEIKRQYPHLKLWLKGHLTERHLWKLPELYGFCGRGNAQGFESCHVKLNQLAHLCRAMKGSERFIIALQRKLRCMDLATVGKVERVFDAQRKKVSSRKPVSERTSSDEAFDAPLSCEVTSEATVFFQNKEYSRISITKCSLCGKRYPTKSKKFHMIYSHTVSCFAFENCNFDEHHIVGSDPTPE